MSRNDGALMERDELSTNAPRRVSRPVPDGIDDNGTTVTIHVQGESFELTDRQLGEAASRVALDATLKKKPAVPGVAADQLRSLVQRIERLEEEKAGISSDIKDIYAEAKGNGYDTPTLKKVIRLRAMDASARAEADHLLDTYCVALGMKPQLDLFHDAKDGGLQ